MHSGYGRRVVTLLTHEAATTVHTLQLRGSQVEYRGSSLVSAIMFHNSYVLVSC